MPVLFAVVAFTMFLSHAWAATPAVTEHPHLLVDKATADTLRDKASREPYVSMIASIKRAVAAPRNVPDQASVTDSALLYDFRPRDLAALYLVSADKSLAAQAEKIVLSQIHCKMWNDPGSKGLTRAAGAVTVALAYDVFYDIWPADTRTVVSRKLRLAADQMAKSMGAGANTKVGNNWQAVRWGAVGFSALASDEPGGVELAKMAYGNLKQHLNANLGDNGWNPEGIGYTIYPWGFTGPFGIAAQRAGIGDLRKDIGKKLGNTLWAIFAGTVNIPRSPDQFGLHVDLSDDNATTSSDGCAGLAFWYCPPESIPGLKWNYDYLCGARGDKSYDTNRGGGLYSLLLYPDSIPAKNPGEVLGLSFIDKSQGVALFRNVFKDENDIVALVNAHARQPQGAHGGPDCNTFRLMGLGSLWVTGGGRTGDPSGQTNMFPGRPARAPRGTSDLGSLESASTERGFSGAAVTTGSSVGTREHKRRFAVDYSEKCGAAALIIDAETSKDGTLWRLNTPGFNKITTALNTFTLTAPNGATLVATILEPAQPDFATGTVRRDDPKDDHGVGITYRGQHYASNAYVEFPCAGNVLVVMTLQKGAAPAVTGSGTASHATVNVGKVSAAITADAITLGK